METTNSSRQFPWLCNRSVAWLNFPLDFPPTHEKVKLSNCRQHTLHSSHAWQTQTANNTYIYIYSAKVGLLFTLSIRHVYAGNEWNVAHTLRLPTPPKHTISVSATWWNLNTSNCNYEVSDSLWTPQKVIQTHTQAHKYICMFVVPKALTLCLLKQQLAPRLCLLFI